MKCLLLVVVVLLPSTARADQLFAAYASVGGTNMVKDPAAFLMPKLEALAPDCIPFVSNPFGSNSLALDQPSWGSTVELMQEVRFIYHHPAHDFQAASRKAEEFWDRAHQLLDDHPELDCMVVQLGSPLTGRSETERHVQFAYGSMVRPDGRMVPCADAIGNAPSKGTVNHSAWVLGTNQFPHRAWEPGLYHKDGENLAIGVQQTEKEWSYFRDGWPKLTGEWFATPDDIRKSGARVFIRSEKNPGTDGWEEENIRLIKEIVERWGPLDGSIVPVLNGSVEQIRAAMDWYTEGEKLTFEALKARVGEASAVNYVLFIMNEVPQSNWGEYVDGSELFYRKYIEWLQSGTAPPSPPADPVAPSGPDAGPGARLHRTGPGRDGLASHSVRGRARVPRVPDRRSTPGRVQEVAHGGRTRTPNRRRSALSSPTHPQDLLDSLRYPTSSRPHGPRPTKNRRR